MAGAVAVAVPYAISPQRQVFFQQYFRNNLRGVAIGRPLTVAAAAVSGAVVWGVADVTLSWLGLGWWTVPEHQRRMKLLRL
jgi:hypothetical protein